MARKAELAKRGQIFQQLHITFFREWKIRDATIGGAQCGQKKITPGIYKFEKVKNPFGSEGFWYVLAGTLVGAPEEMFEDYNRPGAGAHRISITVIPDT